MVEIRCGRQRKKKEREKREEEDKEEETKYGEERLKGEREGVEMVSKRTCFERSEVESVGNFCGSFLVCACFASGYA